MTVPWPTDAATGAALFGVLGLAIGSFLNVVIHRLPRMLERRWAADCAALSDMPGATPAPAPAQPFNLARPRSHCPSCGHAIAWQHNIPLLSFVLLKGRCAHCQARIGWRYPAVEALTGLLFAACAWQWGMTLQAMLWAGFAAALVALAAIDWDTTLLPDDITMPLLWAGILAATAGLTSVGLQDAVWGAAAGYLVLWTVFWGFKALTGKDGMGYGDFKLLGALGAWLGWQALPAVLLLASVTGAVVGIAMKSAGRLRDGGVVPFGPFLALGGLTALLIGPQRLLSWLAG